MPGIIALGIIPAQSEGNDLIVYDPEGVTPSNGTPLDPKNLHPVTRFTFPQRWTDIQRWMRGLEDLVRARL